MEGHERGFLFEDDCGVCQFFKTWEEMVVHLAQVKRPPWSCVTIRSCVYIKSKSSRDGFHELIGWEV